MDQIDRLGPKIALQILESGGYQLILTKWVILTLLEHFGPVHPFLQYPAYFPVTSIQMFFND